MNNGLLSTSGQISKLLVWEEFYDYTLLGVGTFDVNIPQNTYERIMLYLYAQENQSGQDASARIQFNGDTTSGNYTGALFAFYSGGFTVASLGSFLAWIPGSTAPTLGFTQVEIMNPRMNNAHKYFGLEEAGPRQDGNNRGGRYIGRWANNSPINRIVVLGQTSPFTLIAGSRMVLHGLRKIDP